MDSEHVAEYRIVQALHYLGVVRYQLLIAAGALSPEKGKELEKMRQEVLELAEKLLLVDVRVNTDGKA